MTAITNRLRQIIYKHRTQDSCQSKYPAEENTKESQQKNHIPFNTENRMHALKAITDHHIHWTSQHFQILQCQGKRQKFLLH